MFIRRAESDELLTRTVPAYFGRLTIAMKLSTLGLLLGGALASAKQPNILFVLTDDQDLHMNSVEYMPLLRVIAPPKLSFIPGLTSVCFQKHIIEQGTTFAKHFCTVAICCPSRANLWTGHAAHNTNGKGQAYFSQKELSTNMN